MSGATRMKRLSMLLHAGPLTEHCQPPNIASLIHTHILKKPVNLYFQNIHIFEQIDETYVALSRCTEFCNLTSADGRSYIWYNVCWR